MRVLEKILLQLALIIASRRPIPRMYSLGVDSPQSQHYVGVAIEDNTNPKLRFVVQKRFMASLDRFQGRYYVDGMDEPKDACISLTWLSTPKVKITRIYGSLQLDYDSTLKFLGQTATVKHIRIFRRQRRDQRQFNKNFRFSAELAETLRKLFQWQESRARKRAEMAWDWNFNALDAMNALYPTEIWGHKDNNFFFLRFQLALDALVSNGDLERTSGETNKYKLSPKALKTLSDIEIEKSRHQDSAKSTLWLVILTGVIAFFALIEAFQ